MKLKESLGKAISVVGKSKKQLGIAVVMFALGIASAKVLMSPAHHPAHDSHATHETLDAHAEDAHAKTEHSEHGKVDEHGKEVEHADGDRKVAAAHDQPKHQSKGFLSKVSHSIHSIQHKADQLKKADTDNERLVLENLSLRHWAETLKFHCGEKSAKKTTKSLRSRLASQTGTYVGRTLASIDYRPPPHLLPDQLFTLGVSYLQARDYEKSAVIFTFLTGLEEFPKFQTAKNYLLTGIAWYKVAHLKLADSFFDRSLKKSIDDWKKFENETDEEKKADPSEVQKDQVQARLWKALSAKGLTKHKVAQDWLKRVIGRHPDTVEASWVNPQSNQRGSNRSKASSEGHHGSHH